VRKRRKILCRDDHLCHCWSLLRLVCPTPLNQRNPLRRHLRRRRRRQRRSLSVRHRPKQLHLSLALPRQLARAQLVQHHRVRVHVCFRAVRRVVDDLWRHPHRRPHLALQSALRRRFDLRQPKVRQLRVAVMIQQHVGRLDVSVGNGRLARVQERESFSDLKRNSGVANRLLGEVKSVVQTAALHQLHHLRVTGDVSQTSFFYSLSI